MATIPSPPAPSLVTQTAFVRTLLDEVERLSHAEGNAETTQLAEELARLGACCIEAARTMTTHLG